MIRLLNLSKMSKVAQYRKLFRRWLWRNAFVLAIVAVQEIKAPIEPCRSVSVHLSEDESIVGKQLTDYIRRRSDGP